MKTNEAPEKIYILPHKDYSDRRIMNAFTEKEDSEDIEYIRTDAFIKKATEWLKNSTYGYLTEKFGEIELDRETLTVDFANYMKGE